MPRLYRNPTLAEKAKQRDNNTCQNCGLLGAHAHHVVPLYLGGRDVLTNLITLCEPCHGLAHASNAVKARPESVTKYAPRTKRWRAVEKYKLRYFVMARRPTKNYSVGDEDWGELVLCLRKLNIKYWVNRLTDFTAEDRFLALFSDEFHLNIDYLRRVVTPSSSSNPVNNLSKVLALVGLRVSVETIIRARNKEKRYRVLIDETVRDEYYAAIGYKRSPLNQVTPQRPQ